MTKLHYPVCLLISLVFTSLLFMSTAVAGQIEKNYKQIVQTTTSKSDIEVLKTLWKAKLKKSNDIEWTMNFFGLHEKDRPKLKAELNRIIVFHADRLNRFGPEKLPIGREFFPSNSPYSNVAQMAMKIEEERTSKLNKKLVEFYSKYAQAAHQAILLYCQYNQLSKHSSRNNTELDNTINRLIDMCGDKAVRDLQT